MINENENEKKKKEKEEALQNQITKSPSKTFREGVKEEKLKKQKWEMINGLENGNGLYRFLADLSSLVAYRCLVRVI